MVTGSIFSLSSSLLILLCSIASLGFSIKKQWKEKILNHPKLYQQIQNKKSLVIHRLVHELKQFKQNKLGIFLRQEPEYEINIKGCDERILKVKYQVFVYFNVVENVVMV